MTIQQPERAPQPGSSEAEADAEEKETEREGGTEPGEPREPA